MLLAREMGVEDHISKSDSQLVTGQVSEEFQGSSFGPIPKVCVFLSINFFIF